MGKSSYHHGDLRNAMVEAALELMAEGGVEALSLRAAARKAGVSPAAPYRHFDDKSHLLAAVAEQGFNELNERLGAARDAHPDDPLMGFQEVARAYLAFAMDRGPTLRVMFGPEVSDRGAYPELAEAADASMELITSVIATCQREGAVRDGDPLEVALYVWSGIHGAAMLHLSRQLPEAAIGDDLIETLSKWLYTGLAPRRREG